MSQGDVQMATTSHVPAIFIHQLSEAEWLTKIRDSQCAEASKTRPPSYMLITLSNSTIRSGINWGSCNRFLITCKVESLYVTQNTILLVSHFRSGLWHKTALPLTFLRREWPNKNSCLCVAHRPNFLTPPKTVRDKMQYFSCSTQLQYGTLCKLSALVCGHYFSFYNL